MSFWRYVSDQSKVGTLVLYFLMVFCCSISSGVNSIFSSFSTPLDPSTLLLFEFIVFGTTLVLLEMEKDKDNDDHDCLRILSRKDIIRETDGLRCTGKSMAASEFDMVDSWNMMGSGGVIDQQIQCNKHRTKKNKNHVTQAPTGISNTVIKLSCMVTVDPIFAVFL